jgi:hypothetical protein
VISVDHDEAFQSGGLLTHRTQETGVLANVAAPPVAISFATRASAYRRWSAARDDTAITPKLIAC